MRSRSRSSDTTCNVGNCEQAMNSAWLRGVAVAKCLVTHLMLGDPTESSRRFTEKTVERLDHKTCLAKHFPQSVIHRGPIRRHNRRFRDVFISEHLFHRLGRADHVSTGALTQCLHHADIAGGATEESGGDTTIDHQP